VSFSARASKGRSISSIHTFTSSNVQPCLINNFAPENNRYYVFQEKYMLINTSFHGSPLCCFNHTSCIVLNPFSNSNATFGLPNPIRGANCYLPKSGRHVISLVQGLSSSEERNGKSLCSRLTS
jgi:hypothetical protein